MFSADIFAKWLKNQRGNRGLREMATLTGISASTLSRLENGHLPDIESFFMLCDFAGVNPASFSTADKGEFLHLSHKDRVIAALYVELKRETAKALHTLIELAYEEKERV